jgi:hypothetical protein
MKRFYAMEGVVYVNYISLLTEKPMRLEDTPFEFGLKELTPKRAKQIIYSEREAKTLQRINRNVVLVEITENV